MSASVPSIPEVRPVKEVASQLRLSLRTLVRMADRGEFPKFVRLGSKNFVVVQELNAWFERQLAARSVSAIGGER